MLLIVAGPPCTQLTTAGRHAGHQGLCGPDSVHFFVFPALAAVISHLRSGLSAHVVVDNAASMKEVHLRAMMDTLGIATAGATC